MGAGSECLTEDSGSLRTSRKSSQRAAAARGTVPGGEGLPSRAAEDSAPRRDATKPHAGCEAVQVTGTHVPRDHPNFPPLPTALASTT